MITIEISFALAAVCLITEKIKSNCAALRRPADTFNLFDRVIINSSFIGTLFSTPSLALYPIRSRVSFFFIHGNCLLFAQLKIRYWTYRKRRGR